ncbi:hypothetical protein PR048_027905 [Dryococelus australis]|uniref:Secreted protein n=1 Tax=Dryococelus australis TaxID=614101 RepID=A0ABQ9GHV1_9NEOP|nr:hypothetical protein PR048_027905 [Dryococelus australis]
MTSTTTGWLLVLATVAAVDGGGQPRATVSQGVLAGHTLISRKGRQFSRIPGHPVRQATPRRVALQGQCAGASFQPHFPP